MKTNRNNPILLYIMLAAAAVFLLSCAGASQTRGGLATRGMLAMKDTIVGIAEAADHMCATGRLTQNECNQVAELYNKAKISYDAAADMLIVALQMSDVETNWEAYRVFHEKFLSLYSTLYDTAVKLNLIPRIEMKEKEGDI